MRKLVTLRKITKIIPHTNADNLELAIIDGWQVVVKKNEFKQNDLVVYFEIDSLLPITEEFEFLRKSSYIKKDWLKSSFPNGEAFRLRTIKLRKELSQGLIIPISDKLSVVINNGSVNTDDDLSDFFGVKKYDPPLNISNGTRSLVQGKFPESIPKTDQTRIQNLSYDELMESFQLAETFEVTQKYNGSSITIYQTKNKLSNFDKIKIRLYKFLGLKNKIYELEYHFGICSRNLELKLSDKTSKFVQTALDEKYDEVLKFICEMTGWDLAIQGELIGESIQGNWHGISGNTIMIFDIYNISTGRYLDPSHRKDMLYLINSKFPHIKHVDVLNSEYKLTGIDRQQFLDLAEYKLDNGNENEGVVFKSNLRQFSFKAISNSFLLKGGE